MLEKIKYYSAPFLRLILFIILIVIIAVPLILLTDFSFLNFRDAELTNEISAEFGITLSAVGALLLIVGTNKRRTFQGLFFIKEGVFEGFLKGTAIGFVLIGLCGMILMLTGNVVFSRGGMNAGYFFAYLFFFLLVSIFEELTLRTYPLVVFAERYSALFAVVITGLMFGLLHLGNPGFTVIAMINISLAGVLFAVITLQKKNVWWAVGIHFGWNFMQGVLLGYKVSGTDTKGILSARPIGNYWFSGGSFGIEGSLICTVVLILYLAWLLKTNHLPIIDEPLCEDLYLDNEENETDRT